MSLLRWLYCRIFGHRMCGGCGYMMNLDPCYVSRPHCLGCGKEWGA